jgi:hypothetical protein
MYGALIAAALTADRVALCNTAALANTISASRKMYRKFMYSSALIFECIYSKLSTTTASFK